MAEDESFFARWSRLKRQAPAAPAAPAAGAASELPPVDSLSFESDFTGYLKAEVEEGLKRAALKKLFHSPEFNRMDGLDVYIDDYNKFEPIPESMLRELAHAQDMLFPGKDATQADVPQAAAAPEEPSVAPVAQAEPASEPPPPEAGKPISDNPS